MHRCDPVSTDRLVSVCVCVASPSLYIILKKRKGIKCCNCVCVWTRRMGGVSKWEALSSKRTSGLLKEIALFCDWQTAFEEKMFSYICELKAVMFKWMFMWEWANDKLSKIA